MAMLLTEESAEKFLKDKHYKNLKFLGKGAFNMVFKGENSAGDEVAVKLVSDTDEGAMKREAKSIEDIKKLKKADQKYKSFSEELAAAVKKNADYRKHVINPVLKSKSDREISVNLMNELINETKSEKKKKQLTDWQDKQIKSPYKAETYLFEAKLLGSDLEKFTPGNELEDFFPLVKKVARGIFKTLKTLHDKKVAHLDIKSDNVFASDGKVLPKFKLGDYGTAVDGKKEDYDLSTNGDLLLRLIPGFPTDYKTNRPSIEELKKVDIYCSGITILEFFARRYNESETGKQNSGAFELPHGKSYSKDEFKKAKSTFKELMDKGNIKGDSRTVQNFWELIVKTTDDDPSKRWTVDQALACQFCAKPPKS